MLIRSGYEIRYECDVATPMLAMLSVHPSRSKDFATPHRIAAMPDVPMYDYLDGFGNICTRITMPAGGRAIPPTTLTCAAVERYAFRRVDRSNTAGVEARWHDQASAKRKTVKVAGEGKGKAKRLLKVYASKADARAAATAESSRLKRGAAEFDIDLALGRPDLYPERGVTLKGFKAEPDAKAWLIAEATHALDGDGGLTTKLKLETR